MAKPTMDDNSKIWAMLVHASALIAFIGIPFGNIIAPLVIWLMNREKYPVVDEEGKSSLNFQISITIYAIVSILLMTILIGFFLFFVVLIFDFACVLTATIKLSNDEKFDYPLSIKFIK